MLNDSAVGACVCVTTSTSDLTLVSAEGTLRALLTSNVGRGSSLLIVLNTLPLLFLAAIESGKERVLRSTVSAVPVVASALAGMFGHGVVYSGLLATSLLISFGFTVPQRVRRDDSLTVPGRCGPAHSLASARLRARGRVHGPRLPRRRVRDCGSAYGGPSVRPTPRCAG